MDTIRSYNSVFMVKMFLFWKLGKNIRILCCIILCTLIFAGCDHSPVEVQKSDQTEQPQQESVLTQISKAIRKGNGKRLKKILEDHPDLVKIKTKKNETLLHLAAEYMPDGEILAWLIEQGCDIEAKTKNLDTPLFYAAKNSQSGPIKFLLSENADIQAHNRRHEMALHYAARYSTAEIIDILLEQGLRQYESSYREGIFIMTPLTTALRWNPNPEIIERLVKEMPGGYRNLQILYAARYCPNPQCLQILLNYGADPNEGSMLKPLHLAAGANPNPEIAKCLVENGADVNPYQDLVLTGGKRMPNSPLHRAARYNSNIEVSKYLVEQGADFEQKNSHGLTPCDYAIQYSSDLRIVRYYAELYASKHPECDPSLITLCAAAERPTEPEVIEDLVKQVSDINGFWKGQSPLYYALRFSRRSHWSYDHKNCEAIVKILLENGANPDKVSERNTNVIDVLDEEGRNFLIDVIEKYRKPIDESTEK